MVGRLAVAAGEVEPFVVALHLVAGIVLEGDVPGDPGVLHDLAGDLHARHRGVAVGLGRQEIRPDGGLGARRRRLDVDRAAGVGPALADHHRHAGILLQHALLRRIVARVRHVELHVGRLEAGPRAHKAIDDARGQAERALAGRIVLEDFLHQVEAARLLVQRRHVLDAPVHARREVVAVILADALQLVFHLDAIALQQLGLADAGMFEHARRLDRPARHDDLAVDPRLALLAVHRVGDADTALAFEDHVGHQRVGFDLEIRPAARRVEEGARRRPALAVLHRHLVVAEAFLVAVVVVLVLRIAARLGGIDEGVTKRVRLAHVGDVQQAALAAAVVAVRLKMLRLLEVGQHLLVGPAAIAELAPGVVVERLAAHIEHAVDRARATERAAARTGNAAVGHALLRLHLEIPVELLVVQQLGEAGRDVDPHRLVARAGLEQQHLDVRILAQPVGQNAARRAAAHDDVIPIGHDALPPFYSSPPLGGEENEGDHSSADGRKRDALVRFRAAEAIRSCSGARRRGSGCGSGSPRAASPDSAHRPAARASGA